VFVLRSRRACRSSYGSYVVVLLGVATFVLSQLSKMLFLATFVPDAGVSAGLLYQVLRMVTAAVDVAAVSVAFRWARGDARGRVVGLALGWNFGEIVFRRLAFYWMGAWSTEFTWTYLVAALDSNASLLVSIAFVNFVDVWWSSRRLKDGGASPNQPLYYALALCAVLPFGLNHLSEGWGTAAKYALGLVVANAAAKDLNLY
jgi:hypothetical protein